MSILLLVYVIYILFPGKAKSPPMVAPGCSTCYWRKKRTRLERINHLRSIKAPAASSSLGVGYLGGRYGDPWGSRGLWTFPYSEVTHPTLFGLSSGCSWKGLREPAWVTSTWLMCSGREEGGGRELMPRMGHAGLGKLFLKIPGRKWTAVGC